MATKDVKDENKTGTDIKILQSIEKAFFRNNEKSSKRNTVRSLRWFSSYVPKAHNKARTSMIMRDSSLYSDKVIPGEMYFFVYDAKHKDTLPVWDAFPMIFPFSTFKTKRGEEAFLGINLHYLPPKLRFVAMKALLTIRNEKRYRNSTRLRISWEVLQSLSNSKLFEHSVKMYLRKQVRSKFIRIPAQSWELSLFLPLARWQTGGQSQAWKM